MVGHGAKLVPSRVVGDQNKTTIKADIHSSVAQQRSNEVFWTLEESALVKLAK